MTVEWTTQRSARLADFTYDEIERRNLEMWEGEVIEKVSPAGKGHNTIAYEVLFLFRDFCKPRPELFRGGDNDGFHFATERGETFLCPDASLYIKRPKTAGPWHQFAPEIAVEVTSPEDRKSEIRVKRDLYFKGGTQEVWILDPKDRSLEIHYRDGRCLRVTGLFQVSEGIAAGLNLDLEAIFSVPDSMDI